MRKPLSNTLLGGLLSLISTGISLAAPHTESPDAGVTEATSQKLPGGIDSITGTMKPGTTDAFGIDPEDVDVFCFTLDAPVIGASIQADSDGINTNLLLLREGFFGVWGDDSAISDDSGIITDLPAGTYYVAIGNNNIAAYAAGAVDASDDSWDNDDDELAPGEAAIPIAFVGSATSGNADDETYFITFNFQTSADPATVAAEVAAEAKAAERAALGNKIKKLKKKLKKAKGTTKARKLKKNLKKLKKKLKAL